MAFAITTLTPTITSATWQQLLLCPTPLKPFAAEPNEVATVGARILLRAFTPGLLLELAYDVRPNRPCVFDVTCGALMRPDMIQRIDGGGIVGRRASGNAGARRQTPSNPHRIVLSGKW